MQPDEVYIFVSSGILAVILGVTILLVRETWLTWRKRNHRRIVERRLLQEFHTMEDDVRRMQQ